jgi:hypothetical protein
MSTDNCKQFIENISVENNFDKQIKWKRVKKYKNGTLILRDFENPHKDIITISENSTGHLSLFELKLNIKFSDEFKKQFLRDRLLTEFLKFGINNSIINNYSKQNFKNSLENTDWINEDKGGADKIAIIHYVNTNDDSLIFESFQKNILKNEQEIYIGCSIIQENEEYAGSTDNFITDISSEKIGIIYNKENVCVSLKEQEGINYLLVECGGDWENPVISFVYWSVKENRLKSYFPLGDGNIYNQETNTAYGSEFEADLEELDEEKYEKMKLKIDNNYIAYYDKAEAIGFKQFKQFLFDESKVIKICP